MNPTIQDQPLHRLARNFPSHRIETGQNNRIGRVINENRYASGSFKGSDIAAFTADYPPLYFVAL